MFKTQYTLPVTNQQVQYSEFTNSLFFDVLRYIASHNQQGIEDCFDDMINTIVDVSASRLCNMDKFCLLLDIRSMFLGDQLELKSTTSAGIKIKISTILNMLTKKIQAHSFGDQFMVGDVVLNVGLPRSMQLLDDDQIISQCIHNVEHDSSTHWFTDFTTNEQEAFINSLPVDTLNNIKSHVYHTHSNTAELMIIPENVDMGLEGVRVGMYDGSMIEILKSLYNEDLMNFYEMQFHLVTKMNVSYDHFMKMTPSESKIYVSLYNKDIKKQEEALNKQNQSPHSGRGMGGI